MTTWTTLKHSADRHSLYKIWRWYKSFKETNLTQQQIFDIACERMRAQGKPSVSGGKYAYRGDDGCVSAEGALIPASCYDTGIEGYPLPVIFWRRKYFPNIRPSYSNMRLLTALQKAHDLQRTGGRDWLACFEEEVREVARTFKLSSGRNNV